MPSPLSSPGKSDSCSSIKNRELKQTRTTTATWGARKMLFPYFWRLCNSAHSYIGSNVFRFCQSFYCFIASNYRRATVVISQNDAYVLTTTLKWSNWSRTWGTIKSISHIHVLLLSRAITLIVSLTLPSWSRAPWCLSSLICSYSSYWWATARDFLASLRHNIDILSWGELTTITRL